MTIALALATPAEQQRDRLMAAIEQHAEWTDCSERDQALYEVLYRVRAQLTQRANPPGKVSPIPAPVPAGDHAERV